MSPVPCLQVYMELEQGKNVDFWRDMTIITEDEIAKLRKLEASGKGGPGKQEAKSLAWVLGGVRTVGNERRGVRRRLSGLQRLSNCCWRM